MYSPVAATAPMSSSSPGGSVSRLLHEIGFQHLSARSRHPAKKAEELEDLKENFPHLLAAAAGCLPSVTPIEIGREDELRLGQKNGLIRQWAGNSQSLWPLV